MPPGGPRISCVLPVYNAEPYLRIAIDSLLQQTFTDFARIIIDDGSSDGSYEIIQSYQNDPRIIIIRHPENRRLPPSMQA